MKRTGLLLLFSCCLIAAQAQKKGKGKDKDKKAPVKTDYITVGDATPVPDTTTKFTGVIKYRMTTDDPADRDSMFIIFGDNRIRFTMFNPGYKEGQVFETNMIANMSDSTLFVLDTRNKTYKIEKFTDRNSGTEFTLANYKKTAPILKFICSEFSGEMKTPDGEVFEAAALVSKQHSYISALDYNFLNIQPVVLGYRIVLGYRTKSSDNESTYIIAYSILPGDVSSYFDLSGYRVK